MKIIVAYDKHRGIGKDNAIPWYIKDELNYFKQVTTHTNKFMKSNVVIMGRKTWESIPENHRPLKDRINIVISSTSSTSSASAYFQPSLEAAFQLIDTLANVNNDNIFIIGGERLYTEAIERTDCEKIYVTEIYGSYECERFFPEIPASFILTNVSKFKSENNTYYRNLIYTILARYIYI